jgi:hypothetical protein
MTFSILEPDAATYHLWRRFSMPTTGGSRDAIAVPSNVADKLNSAYTFLVSMIIINTWVLILLVLLPAYIRRRRGNDHQTKVGTAIWNAKASPLEVARVTATNYHKHRRQWSLLLWMTLAFGILVAHYAIPIEVVPYILLGNAAPVAADAIYVPSLVAGDSVSRLKEFYLQAPAAFRAVGNAQVANSSKNSHVSVDKPVFLHNRSDGEAIMRVSYRYSVSGVDLGLQHYPDLVLNVEGSCTTDYGPLVLSSVVDGIAVDTYLLWPGNPDYAFVQNVSLFDGPMPQGFLRLGPQPPTGPPGNFTWAAVVSSLERLSVTEGRDPWYLTNPIEGTEFHEVKGGRPALSCWQNDVWSYKGHNSTIIALNSTALPGLDLPGGLQSILRSALGEPRIVSLATQLGPQALASTTTSLGQFFDAEESSIYQDIQRLAFASYVASTNVLTESTLYPQNRLGLPNFVPGNDSQLLPGAADFVIWSGEVRTLSVRPLIIIPAIALGLFLIIVFVIIFYPPLGMEARGPPEHPANEPVDVEKGLKDNGAQDR